MIVLISLITSIANAAIQDLPELNADITHTTVSGISSGAYMAVQMHFAYSQFIKGAGVFAGGPYLCALGDFYRATGA